MPDSNPTIQNKLRKLAAKTINASLGQSTWRGPTKSPHHHNQRQTRQHTSPTIRLRLPAEGNPSPHLHLAPNHTERMDTEYACNPPPRPTSEEGEGENPGRRG